MLNKALMVLGFLTFVPGPALPGGQSHKDQILPENQSGTDAQLSHRSWVASDLRLAGRELASYQPSETGRVMVFRGGFAMSIADNQLSSDSAVLWLQTTPTKPGEDIQMGYKILAYLQDSVSLRKAKAAETEDIPQTVVQDTGAMVVRLDVSGEVFITADKTETADPRGSALYTEAFAAVAPFEPELQPKPQPEEPPESSVEKPAKPTKATGKPPEKELTLKYPVNYAQVGEVPPNLEWEEQTRTGTVIGRFCLWQKQDEKGRLLELQADNGVIFFSDQQAKADQEKTGLEERLAKTTVSAVYLCGDVVMTEGQRTIRADQIYYDFEGNQALVTNAVMRTYDVARGIPIYVRAARLRQLGKNRFAADNITLTTSEFYLPQVSLNASKVLFTDTSPVDEPQGKLSDRSFDAQIEDVQFKIYDKTFFYWPSVRANLIRPDVPLKGIHAGHDRTWGTSVETQWYLARLLGLKEPEGTESTIGVDYYSERGLGSGVEVNYTKDDYFGKLLGYIIDDHGEDRLGRDDSRKDLEPPHDLRGRFKFQHRHFLPYSWQLTTEVSYASDKNFIEQYYRREFNTDKEQETIVHAKRIEDNWGLSLLGKWRLNDFTDNLEELPTAEFHWTGQSLLDDRLTLYSDSQVSRFRQRLDSDGSSPILQDFFTFMSTRNELGMPMTLGRSKIVPFVAGTLGYEDGDGFRTDLDGSPSIRDDGVWLAEAGVRIAPQPWWKVYPEARSRLWDLNRLRHVIQPRLTAVTYAESDSVVEQRDVLNAGISQRLQTKRGPSDKLRTVDWMRLDVDFTWVTDSGDTSAGPDRFIWNKPFIPLANTFSRRFSQTVLPAQDRRSSDIFGPRRNYIGADYVWRLTDTTAVLSDLNFDMQSGAIQQFNIGFSHLSWPNLSYYIGSRYLRRLDNTLGEKGSNALTFAATYVLDPRYTLVFSQQYDFDYGLNIRSDITLIRCYHRVYFGLTYSADESLDQHAVVFSIWPQGVPELAIGPRRYMPLAGPEAY
jgi:hypothetical protein